MNHRYAEEHVLLDVFGDVVVHDVLEDEGHHAFVPVHAYSLGKVIGDQLAIDLFFIVEVRIDVRERVPGTFTLAVLGPDVAHHGAFALGNVGGDVGIVQRHPEERHSRQIAHQIVTLRKDTPFTDTLSLANAIHAVMPHKKGDIDSATRTFQALRIYVNDELGELERALNASVKLLKIGGILAVVTFHSLEDRIVKNFFAKMTSAPQHINKYKKSSLPPKAPFDILNKKPISATDDELKQNPRSRSAHLRCAVYLGDDFL